MDKEKIFDIRFKKGYLVRLLENGYRYIATDYNGSTLAYKNKPVKSTFCWGFNKNVGVVEDFEPIRLIKCKATWADKEPTSIWEEIKECNRILNELTAGDEINTEEKQWNLAEHKHDNVNHPTHYTWKKKECKEIQRDMLDGLSGAVAGYMFVIIKYLYRVGHKDCIRQDLDKAKKYIDFMCEEMEKE